MVTGPLGGWADSYIVSMKVGRLPRGESPEE